MGELLVRNVGFIILALLMQFGCAVSPEAESRRQDRETSINEILAQQLHPAELGHAQRCLAEREYNNFRALGDRYMLFEGRGDKLWISSLRTRCPDLRHGDLLVVKSFSYGRICSMDTFQVSNWFDWPWRWASTWHTGTSCTFGKFQPVTKSQVADIQAVLKSR